MNNVDVTARDKRFERQHQKIDRLTELFKESELNLASLKHFVVLAFATKNKSF